MSWINRRTISIVIVGCTLVVVGPFAAARSAPVGGEDSIHRSSPEPQDRMKAEQELNAREADENEAETGRQAGGNHERRQDQEAAEKEIDRETGGERSHVNDLQDVKSDHFEKEDQRVKDNVRDQEDKGGKPPRRERDSH